MYYEKLALTLASGDIPSILVTGKSPEFMNAVENDAFWDISDYVYNYQNLSQMSETVYMNAAINGRLYGVPRSRDLGRNGFGYRLDWLNNLGLKEPETIEELYDMLVGFTYDDPDGNGKDDTYGLGVTSYTGTWDIMQVWFGAPNGWGIDENGDLIPAHLTKEYDNALAWFRKIYSEGLVNPDFNEVAGGDWDTVLLRSGVAGATADVVDRFRRNQEYFEGEGIPAEHMIIGCVDAGFGKKTLPTAGYSDLIAISKQKVKTEEEMKIALQFLDALSDAEMLALIEFGYENESYYIDDNGYGVLYTEEEKTAMNFPIYDFKKGLNQLLSYWISPEEEAKRIIKEPPSSEIRLMEAAVKKENEKYAVPNYGASYTSETYTQLAGTLDPILNDARIAYIMGEIDGVGLQEAKEQWLRNGGQTVIDEMNERYHAAKN
jgi:putative aldouronate transport system substrate-binding protein